MERIEFTLNGSPCSAPDKKGLTLMKFLRDEMKLTGTKCGCGMGECGSCKILVDGKAVPSCTLTVKRVSGCHIITVEGLAGKGVLHPVQQAFIDAGAVQCGFCTPGMIITTVELLESSPLPSEEEIRKALEGNLCRCTGYEKIVKAVQLASGQLTIEAFGEGVGSSAPVVEAEAKVRGELKYTADMDFQGALTGRVLYAPAPHGRVTRIDMSEALALPGVVDAVSFDEQPRRPFNSHITVPYQDVPKNEMIFNRHFRYRGDRIAAVAAVDAETAAQALKLIKVEYESYPFMTGPEESLKEGAFPIHSEGNNPSNLSSSIGKGFDATEGDFFLEDSFETGRVTHAAMEPHAVAALYDGSLLTVYTACQNVFCYQAMLAELFDLPYNRIRVIKPPVGGAFGGKSEMVLEPVAALLALRTGRPVTMEMTRREVFSSTRTRTPSKIRTRLAVGDDQLLKSMTFDVVLDRGAYFGSAFDLGYALMDKAYRLYRIPDIAARVTLAYSNNQPAGAMRGYGNPQLNFAREVMIDRVCREKQWDPVDFRLKNLVQPGDKNPLKGGSLGDCYPAECLQKGAELFDWKAKRAGCGSGKGDGHVVRGVGVASGVHGAGIYPGCVDYSTAALKLFPDGSAILNISAHENGQGSNRVMKKIVSTVLGIPEQKIGLVETDTHVSYYDNGSYASRETWVCGQAVLRCAEKLQKMLLDQAADLNGCAADELRFQDGRVFRGNEQEDEGFTLAHLVHKAQTSYPFKDMAVVESASSPYDPGAYLANFAEVEVNLETAEVKVLSFLAVHNTGTVINPVMCEGQVEGGLHMGMGFALSECLDVDPESGLVLNFSFKKYGFLRASQMPRIQSAFLDRREEAGPLGAKSLGEATTPSVAPAIINALSHATGLEFSTLPVTREVLREKLGKRGV